MVVACLRGVVMVFCLLAFLGGTTVQAMPLDSPAATPTIATAIAMPDDCPMAQIAGTPAKDGPCHGLNAACLKQMGCLGVSLLPERSGQPGAPAVFSMVLFWPPSTTLAGLSIAPEPFPPIAA
ncbi:hypothetical protein Y958_26000 [Nitrospirillum viridazoti CBAmc]|uniref:Uncharacterized protein n=1 Tax=Nitrospirillum viridazoti CBAmc TaxID=1441467 RepID=A0A248K039_9PROT|nr:hypothetical protein Y958_26000 [Nitrospirillum amazonense CBAmc]